MSTVSSATNTQATSQQQSSGVAKEPVVSPERFGEEFMSFIQLLTAQVRNQDPLSPMDSTQFVEQLATFSNLEQQVVGNKSLESIATMIGDLHSMLASEWLGQRVSVETSWVPYSGDPVDFEFDLPDGVDKAVLAVVDTDGEAVWSQDLDLSKDAHSWDGDTLTGQKPATDTLFEFGISLNQDGQYLGTVAPRIITEVTDVASENGTMRVGTSSRVSADMSAVRKVE